MWLCLRWRRECRRNPLAGRLPTVICTLNDLSTVNSQRARTIQEAVTTLSPAEVIVAAKVFFARRNSIYTAFVDREGPGYVTFRGQGGEEIVIGAVVMDDDTRVTGSTYLFDQQVARFLATLPARAGFVGVVEETAPVDVGA